jgi:periplasmic protein TonB
MTSWVPIKVQRTTGTAVLFSVAMHALVLIGVTQYNMRPHGDVRLDKQSRHPPIEVMLLAEPMVALKTMVTKAVPDSKAPSSAESVRHKLAAHTAPQTKQSVANREIHTESRAVEDVAHDIRMDGHPTEALTTASKSGASAGEQSRNDVDVTVMRTTPAEGQADPRPSQGARPDYAYNPQPDYPMLLREQGVGGVVWLRVWVDSDGRPVEIKLAKGSGYRLLDDAALRAVKQWRFIPAKNGEQRMASWVEFPIRFTLIG